MAWHPEGRYLLAGTTTGHVWLVEPETGNARELKRGDRGAFEGNRGGPLNVDFSPDGRFAAAAGQIRLGELFSGPIVWDVSTGRVVHEFSLEEGQMSEGGWNFYHFQYGLDGNSLVTGGPHGIRIWSLEEGSSEYIGDGNYVAQSSDGRRVFGTWGLITAYGNLDDSGAVRVHDLDSAYHRDPLRPSDGHESGYWPRTIEFWSPSTGMASCASDQRPGRSLICSWDM